MLAGSQGQLEQEAARQSQDPLHETLQEGGAEQASRDTWMTETAGRNILTGKMAEDTQDEPPEATKKEKVVLASREFSKTTPKAWPYFCCAT